MRWAERAREKITRRIIRRIHRLKYAGHEMSSRELLAHNLAAYRDLAYMACLRPFLRRERGRE